jgi:hypothetical protein
MSSLRTMTQAPIIAIAMATLAMASGSKLKVEALAMASGSEANVEAFAMAGGSSGGSRLKGESRWLYVRFLSQRPLGRGIDNMHSNRDRSMTYLACE